VVDLAVDLARCVRCAACSTVAPMLFEVTKKGTRVIAQPREGDEAALARAAALICPTHAITGGP
jgi:ferredoxin